MLSQQPKKLLFGAAAFFVLLLIWLMQSAKFPTTVPWPSRMSLASSPWQVRDVWNSTLGVRYLLVSIQKNWEIAFWLLRETNC